MSNAEVMIEIDLQATQRLIERSATLLPQEDAAELRRMFTAVVAIVGLVRERGTTIKRLRRLFGLSKSEKTADVIPPKEAPTTATQAMASAESTPTNEPDSQSATTNEATHDKDSAGNDGAAGTCEGEEKKGHGRIGSSEYINAHRTFVPFEDLQPGSACPSGCGGKVRGKQDPAVTIRIKGRAPLEAEHWACERLRCDTCGKPFTARMPREACGPKYDATAASMIAVLHYGSGVPFYRLDRLQRDLGTPVPASTQWEIVRNHAEGIAPAYHELLRHAARGSVVYTDDTYACILQITGKRRAKLVEADTLPDPERTGLFTTGLVSQVGDKMISLFFTGRRHAGQNLKDVLARRPAGLPTPIHMSDGLSRNTPQGHDVLSGGCVSHGRRGIVDQVQNFPVECELLLKLFGKIFETDAAARRRGLSDDARLQLHQRCSGPVMGQIKKTINTLLRERRVEENSDLGKALLYLRRQWRKLTLFLRVAGAPLTNNLCERVLKMAILYRKNSYFYRSELGAMVGDSYMSLIHTATLCGENPFDYLTELIRHEKEVAAAPAEWMPWTFRDTLARSQREMHRAA